MHSLIGYDEGRYNDFLLRQKIFSHWRRKFFMSFYEEQKPKKYMAKDESDTTKTTDFSEL